MKKAKGKMDESILVCVYYGPNGERLIRRGCELAGMLHCPLYVLTIDAKPFDELDAEKVAYIERWRQIATEKHEIHEFILKDEEVRPVPQVIAEVARNKHITQIILGQTAKSRWEEFAKGSIINILLKEIPFVDLHIISVARELKNEEGYFEKGIRAYVIPDGKGYRLTFTHSKDVLFEGIFFKEIGTDFNNGIFKYIDTKKMRQVRVMDDYIYDLKDVNITKALLETDSFLDKED